MGRPFGVPVYVAPSWFLVAALITWVFGGQLERVLPEKRLFLRSDDDTRFVRLRPLTQLAAISGITLAFGWTLVASSVLAIDAISAGSSRDTIVLTQAAFEERLAELSQERDARAAEALAAQNRFAAALDQVSQMQSQLLESEEQRRELEAGLDVVQSTLRDAIGERDSARAMAEATDAQPDAAHPEEVTAALDIVTGELRQAMAKSGLTRAGAGGVGSLVRPIGKSATVVTKMVTSGARLPSAGMRPKIQAPTPRPST